MAEAHGCLILLIFASAFILLGTGPVKISYAKSSRILGAGLAMACLCLCGCNTYRESEPPRTATEQLLLSTAADRALRSADLAIFANHMVFVDGTYFDSYDPKYVLGTIRDALSRAGALLAPDAGKAEIILEARSGALSTDSGEGLFGIPAMGAPIPLTGAVSIPQVALYTSKRMNSTAKIALLGYSRASLRHIYSSGPLVGFARDNKYDILGFIKIHRTTIPEKQTNQKKKEREQSWEPDYSWDWERFNPTNAPGNAANSSATKPAAVSTNAPAGARPK